MPLVQHFSIQVSRHLFAIRANGWPPSGFVASDMPLRRADAAGFGLAPVWIYTIGVEGLPARHIEIFHPESAVNPIRFLVSAWRSRLATHGMPDLIRVQREIELRFPEFRWVLDDLGVSVRTADGRDIGFSTRLRLSQGDAGMALCYPWKRLGTHASIDDVNRELGEEGDGLTRYIFSEARSAAMGVLGRNHMILPPEDADIAVFLARSDENWRAARSGEDITRWFAVDQSAIPPCSSADVVGYGDTLRWLAESGALPEMTTEHWHAADLEETKEDDRQLDLLGDVRRPGEWRDSRWSGCDDRSMQSEMPRSRGAA
jgi:hypothetical protein